MASAKLLGKFRGCFVGGLIGDCFGAPFEWDYPVSKTVLVDFLSKKLAFQKGNGGTGAQILPYTDDTEMARSVAESLITKNGFNAEDMAQRFAEEYFRPVRPKRGYGTFVTYVFKSFKQKSYTDIFEPATAQFEGAGSFGNGAAMRTHPVALFCHDKSQDTLLEICRQSARLTHAHMDGYNGAILQTLAVKLALEADPTNSLEPLTFLEKLEKVMSELEATRAPNPKYPSFCTQIENIRTCLKDTNIDPTDVGKLLGNHVTAVLSVPSAIYCFLRAQTPVKGYETTNHFLRTLYLSIALGGDTDTIASMACSIAGAFYGTPEIPSVLYEQCEASTEILDQSNRMANLVGVH